MPSTSSEEFKPAGLPCPNSSASYWHSEPNVFLLNHRTTSSLPETCDIVIIGSGITGASVARYLAQDDRMRGLSVVMLEAREACWGATGRNGGHCQPLLTERPPNIGRFEIKNVDAVKTYIEDHNVDCDWRLGSACRAFFSQQLWDEGMKELEVLANKAPELRKRVTVITDKQELAKHRVAESAIGATITQGAAQLWPYKYVTAVLEDLVKAGRLNLQTNTPVTYLKSHQQSSNGHEVLLSTPRGLLKAKHVILATNGYTSHLIPSFSSLIVPTRCEMSALHPPANAERLPHSYGFVGKTVADDDYLIQLSPSTDAMGKVRPGRLMFGGGSPYHTYPRSGITDDDIVDPGEASYLRKQLLKWLQLGGDDKVVEGQGELIASHQWTGIKGYSRDNMPWVGKVPKYEGVWLAGGYTGHGMPNATLCGKAVAMMVLSQLSPASTQAAESALTDVTSTLMADGDLPEQYLLTPERIQQTLKMPTVAMREEEAMRPLAGDLVECGADGFVRVRQTDAKTQELAADVQGKCVLM